MAHGWDQLSNRLCDALCNAIGDTEFQEWLAEVTGWARENGHWPELMSEFIKIPRERFNELLRELRAIREECSAQSGRIAQIVGEITEISRTQREPERAEETPESQKCCCEVEFASWCPMHGAIKPATR